MHPWIGRGPQPTGVGPLAMVLLAAGFRASGLSVPVVRFFVFFCRVLSLGPSLRPSRFSVELPARLPAADAGGGRGKSS